MSAYVTREIIDTAARAEWDQYRPDLDGGPWEGLTEAQRASWRKGVEVALAAAIPLVTPAIKAEALREAVEDWRRGHTFSVMEDWLSARADRIEREAE